MRFWKPYVCSNKLDVSETNFSFAQFNRMRNHLFGRWNEIRRDSCSRFMGSDRIKCGKDKNEFHMFMTVTMESAVLMGKIYLNNCQSIANTTDLTLKQVFDISTRLVSEQDDLWIGNIWLGKSIMEIPIIDW